MATQSSNQILNQNIIDLQSTNTLLQSQVDTASASVVEHYIQIAGLTASILDSQSQITYNEGVITTLQGFITQ